MFTRALTRVASQSVGGGCGAMMLWWPHSHNSRRMLAASLDQTKVAKDNVSTKDKKEAKGKKQKAKKVYALGEFFDKEQNWGKQGALDPSDRPGRSWTADELRLKSSSDLHKLWYVLLKERNMLLTMQEAYAVRHQSLPNPERIDRVNESMENLEAVVHERNDAFLRLETGDGAAPPKRTVTSFMGFTYEESAKEHYLPEAIGEKEYEVPMLDEQAHVMQVLWREKEHLKTEAAEADEYLFMDPDRDEQHLPLIRGQRRYIDRVEDLPSKVVARRRKERADPQIPTDPYQLDA